MSIWKKILTGFSINEIVRKSKLIYKETHSLCVLDVND